MEEQINKEKKNLTVSHVLAWILGVLFLIVGIVDIIENPLSGILFILASAVILPPAYNFISKKWNVSLSKGLRIIIVIIILTIGGLLFESDSPEKEVPVAKETESATEEVEESVIEDDNIETNPVVENQPNEMPIIEDEPTPKQEQVAEPTLGEKQAAISAKNYLNYTTFSKKGLIEQLEYEGYTTQQAEYGVSQTNADWNEQAALAAQNYIEYTAFSRSGLIDQLVYEGFTRQQAEYGAEAVGY